MSKLDPKDLPPKVAATIKSSFSAIPVNTDLKAYNSEWEQKHLNSPSHLQAAYNVRFLLDPNTKGQNEADVKELLNLPSITLEQAVAGLELLDEWKTDAKVKDGYRETASEKWPEATVFQKS